MTQHHHQRGARFVVLGEKRATQHRRHVQHSGKHANRELRTHQRLGVSQTGERRAPPSPDCDLLEYLLFPPEIVKAGNVQPFAQASGSHRVVGPNRHETIRLGKRQGSQHDAIHYTEDRGARTDAESQRENDDSGGARVLQRATQGVSHVSQKSRHDVSSKVRRGGWLNAKCPAEPKRPTREWAE